MAKPWMRWILVLQCVLLLAMFAGMVANKFGLAPFRQAFMTFYYGFQGVIVVTGLTVLACGLIWWLRWHAEKRFALWTLALGAAPVVVVFALVGKGLGVPAIHNISTDLENPPKFIAAYELRSSEQNSLDAPSDAVKDLQRGHYADLAPLILPEEPDAVFARALATVADLGWTLIAAHPEQGLIEAYDETLFFGFKDDVAIRIQAQAQGTRVDVRSVSRVGRSDLGANAKRIAKFQKALEK